MYSPREENSMYALKLFVNSGLLAVNLVNIGLQTSGFV
jgi:hypothetical protein